MTPFWTSLINGLTITFSLIIAIGAQNAFILGQSLRREHHVCAAMLCAFIDFVLISLGVFGLAQWLTSAPGLMEIARWGGIVFLTAYAIKSVYAAVRPAALKGETAPPEKSRRAVLLTTLAVTLLNPHVYLDTVLLIGSIGAQQSMPSVYAIGASGASLIWFAGLAFFGFRLAPWLTSPHVWRIIDIVIALMMMSIVVGLLLNGPTLA